MLKTVSSITNAIGALNYKGTWNASTNTPTITSSSGVKGDYYVVSVSGATAIDGISNWGVGDWITFNGSVWQRVEGGADLNGVNLTFTGTASGPTYETSNATTGLTIADNEIEADGTDTDIDINIIAKGAGKANITTGGILRAQVDGARLTMGGTRAQDASFGARSPATLWLWGDTGLLSYSVKMMHFKNTFTDGVAVSIFDITKTAGSGSTSISQLGGVIRISSAFRKAPDRNVAEFVEIPFSLGCNSSNNIALATGTQRVVTSVNNTGGAAGAYALSLTGASNTAATLELTITRTDLAEDYIGIEMDAIGSSDSAGRLMIVSRN